MTDAANTRRLEDELAALRRVSEMVATSASLDDVSGRCLDLSIELAGASGGAIYLCNTDTGAFDLSINRRLTDRVARRSFPSDTFAEELRDASYYFFNVKDRPFGDHTLAELRAAGIQSFVVLALRSAGKMVGALGLAFLEPREPPTLDTLIAIAGYEGVVIENARSRAAAAERAERVDRILRVLPMSVLIVERSGKVHRANDYTGQIAATVGMDIDSGWQKLISAHEFLRPDGSSFEPKDLPLARALRGERVTGVEVHIRIPNSDRKYAMLVSCAPVSMRDGQVEEALVVAQDISQLRELMEAKERFLSIAAHELRSPIASLRATTSLLQLDSTVITNEMRRNELFDRLNRQSDRLVSLINQLLESARLGEDRLPLSLMTGDLVSVAREAIAIAATPEDLPRIEFAHPDAIIGVWDLSRVEQVIVNLLTNALRYGESSNVRLALSARGDEVCIDVTDHGKGIEPHELPRIFSPFFRSARGRAQNAAGLGLGLYITHAIVRRHGGHITVTSQVESGTTFTVHLPLNAKLPT